MISLVLVSAGVWCGCQVAASDAPLSPDFRWYFAGSERLARDTNAAQWVKLMNLPEARELREQTLLKLAKAPFQFFQNRVGGATNDCAALIRPLLDDLLRAESYAEGRQVGDLEPELALAVKLNATAAGTWDTNLYALIEAWTGIRPERIRVKGRIDGEERLWVLKKHDPPRGGQLVRIGEWVVLSCGGDSPRLQAELLGRIAKDGRPWGSASLSWLDLFADWRRLKPHLPFAVPSDLPATHLTVTGSGESLRTKVNLVYPEPVRQSFEPWQIPTNTIHEPLISFTACRGIGPWLKRIEAIQRLNLAPLPDQIYGWGIGNVPFQSFLAAPSQNPTNLLACLATNLMTRFNESLRRQARGEILWSPSIGRIHWNVLPFIFPFVEPAAEPSGPFLLTGVFPNNPRGQPPPAELLQQVAERTNLVYYDWEVTQPRLSQCQSIAQLYRMALGLREPATNVVSLRWLNAIGPNLGNAVTELNVTGPKQLTLVRKSGIGLTAIELMALAAWLESPKFPLGDYRLPARTSVAGTVPATNSANAETRR